MQPRKCVVELMEDNTATMQIIKTGRNPALRHINRTQKVSVAWLHDVFDKILSGQLKLTYCPTAEQKADIFTKAFTDVQKWAHACQLIGVHLPPELARMKSPEPEACAIPACPACSHKLICRRDASCCLLCCTAILRARYACAAASTPFSHSRPPETAEV